MDLGLTLLCLVVFLINNAEAETSKDVTLQCDPETSVFGQDATLNCMLDSTARKFGNPCKEKNFPPDCMQFEPVVKINCSLEKSLKDNETALEDNQEGSRVRHIIVKIHKVNESKMFKVSMSTSCGIDVEAIVRINVTVITPESQGSKPPEAPAVTNIVVPIACIAVVILVIAVVLGIRKYRGKCQQDYSSTPQQPC